MCEAEDQQRQAAQPRRMAQTDFSVESSCLPTQKGRETMTHCS